MHPAEKAAQDLLESTWHVEGTCPIPVDPFDIADRLGLQVSVVPLEPDVSGMLSKRPFEDPVLYVNAFDSANRQRFSCAHEIGHYDERASTQGEDDSWGYIDRRGPSAARGDNPSEIYANKFAAQLLMPRDLITERFQQTGISAMAVEFGVSVEAMVNRIDNLRLRAN